MDYMDKAFHAALADALSFKEIGGKLIAGKLTEQGIILDQDQIERIESRLEELGDNVDLFNLEDILTGDASHLDLEINIGDEDLDQLVGRVSEEATRSLPSLVEDLAITILATLKSDAARMLQEHRAMREGFENRLHQRWGAAFDLLEMLIVMSSEAGSEFNQEFRPDAVDKHDCVFEVLTRLHARACQVAYEVLNLLRAGLADGAHARWRTLHEVAVIGFFVKQEGNDTAERYLLHDVIESFKAHQQHLTYANKLGLNPATQQSTADLVAKRDALLQQYGDSFRNDYGWAVVALGQSKPTFAAIEKHVGLDHLRPYYRLASHNVHANPKGLLFKLGLSPHNRTTLLAGPSDAGLADPGQGTAISLSQITTSLLTSRVNVDRLVVCQIVQKAADEVCEAFIAAHQEQEV